MVRDAKKNKASALSSVSSKKKGENISGMDDARYGSAAWGKSLYERERETLPIKKADGKIVRQVVREVIAASDEEDEEVSDNESKDGSDEDAGGKSEFQVERSGGSIESDNEYEFQAEYSDDDEIIGVDSDLEDTDGEEKEVPKKAKKDHKQKRQKKKRKQFIDSDDSDDENNNNADSKVEVSETASANSPEKKKSKDEATKHKYLKALSRMPSDEVLQYVGNICRGVLDSPEMALKRRAPGKVSPLLTPEGASGSDDVDADYKLLDLFDLLSAKEEGIALFDTKVLEMAMLSMLLIFKDIIPAYRIRPLSEKESTQEVKLKKQTKALRDFELALLGAYQRYLKLLESYTTIGLGNISAVKKQHQSNNTGSGSKEIDTKLGLSALRCQCELMVNKPHFNFRQKLLVSVVKRAAQSDKKAGDLARESLELLFTKDKQGEATLECVKLMATTATTIKFRNLPEEYIRCLFSLRLEVRAEDARALKMKAKKARRKRKRAEDDIGSQMTQTSMDLEKVTTQKLQANTLHEISLIYFRIIKGKVGYDLLPVALEGLGRIAHLLNYETMDELVELMRGLVERKDGGSALPAPEIQLKCLSCALKVLSGPGEALEIDITFFANRLATLVYQLPSKFDRWDIVLECIELCFGARKKNDRTAPIQAFIKILLQCSGHQQTSTGGVTVLAVAHSMLLQYPRLRTRYVTVPKDSKARPLFEEDDEVGDMAMQALRTGLDASGSDANVLDSTSSLSENGSWMVSLLQQHYDPMVRHVIKSLVSKDINPLPVRTADARFQPIIIANRTDSALAGVSKMLEQATARRVKAQSKNHKMAESKALHRQQEVYKEETERRWKLVKHVHHAPDASAALRNIFNKK